MKFIHLHNHSENSLLDGVGVIGEWVKRAKELELPALAITDHGNLNGIQQLIFSCKEEGIKPIVGVEAYIVPNRIIKKHKEYRNHITLLAKNTKGYHNLIKLISQANIDGFYNKPRIDFELLKQYREGLIVLSGCLAGVVYQNIMRNNIGEAEREMLKYQKVFGDDYYIEIMLFPNKDFTENYPKVVELANKLGIPIVLTNDSHYLYEGDNLLQDILFMIKKKSSYANVKKKENSFKFSLKCLWMKSLQQILKVWKDYYEHTISKEILQEAIKNTVRIADKIEEYKIDKSNKYPEISIDGKKMSKEEMNNLLKRNALKGYREKGLHKEDVRYFKRLKYELNIVINKGMAAYFLILADVVNWARSKNILVGYGRGSVAGCLLAYLLGIHNVDPIKHKLLFERFINKSSDGMPDIDVDFDARYREDIKQYLINKYGSDKVGEIATYGMMKIKMAIKDVARVYGFDYRFINEVTKQIGDNEDLTKEELRNLIGDLRNKDIIINLALRMQGQTRHMSVHPAGLVITPTPLTDYIPLQRYKDKLLTGWTEGVYRREITTLGLVKYDILGLRTLSIVADCFKFIEKRCNKKIKLNEIPLGDEEVFKNYRKDLVIGIFQCESSTMRGLIKKLKPKEFEDIIALLALDRPAPLSIGVFDKFLANRRSKETYRKFNPQVWEILKDTHGVLLYQEQVLNLVKILAGFDSAQRLTIKKLLKKPPKGKTEHTEFLKKQKELGELFIKNSLYRLGEEEAKELWEDIKAYGEYGFNRSHSCSYALLSYATMWLKTYYPIEFYTALLNHTKEDIKLDQYRQEISKAGIKVLPADINKSKEDFIIEGENIRYGLKKLKGIGSGSEAVVKRQPYQSIEDFLLYALSHKKEINKRVILALIKSGAFDNFCDRGRALHIYRQKVDRKYIRQYEKLNDFQKLEGEKDVYGFYFDGDIQDFLKKHLAGDNCLPLLDALKKSAGERVKVFAKIDRINVTDKGIFINISSGDIKTVIIGWRGNISRFRDKFISGDIIVADVHRMNFKGKKEFIIKDYSQIKKIGG